MLYVILSGFVFSVSLLLWNRHFQHRLYPLASLLPLTLFSWFLTKIPAVSGGHVVSETFSWVPSLSVDLSFTLDGLSLLFALLITGIGTLVFVYTASYLKGHRYLGRFYAYLAVFMSAMLGLVLAGNIITLFIFWELTSISSFFLIGFNNEEAASRKSALDALLITGLGGFMLLIGGVLLGSVTGTFEIAGMLAEKEVLMNSGLYPLILLFIFLAAFTKSAQYPFHFWLPGAMKAPTPVSTYLHSATMVKAGVYLLLRLSPLLGPHPWWNHTLLIVGGFTMLYAAFTAVYKTDLKAILAYTTVASLGMMIFLTGIGTAYALAGALMFILAHGLYKASLFLITGIIDHETGIRDVRSLAGLRKVMMPVAVTGLLAALISGGIPPTVGFLSKELIYDSALQGINPMLLAGTAVLTNILLFYAGFLAGVKPFAGRLPDNLKSTHMPPLNLWLPPAILVALGIVFGVIPLLAEKSMVNPALQWLSPEGGSVSLKLWHGFNRVLLLSAITIGAGLLMYFLVHPSGRLDGAMIRQQRISPEGIFNLLLNRATVFARYITRTIQNGFLRKYLVTVVLLLCGLLLYVIISRIPRSVDWARFSRITASEVTILAVIIAAIVKTVYARSRLTAVVALGVLGFAISILFVFYSAPDLAMTQFSVDTLTVVLFVLVLFRLPKLLKLSKDGFRPYHAAVSILFGLLIAYISVKVLEQPVSNDISRFYAENAYVLAKGKNIVNVILVDFRGVDTLVEICVLIIAAIGVLGLIKISLKEKY